MKTLELLKEKLAIASIAERLGFTIDTVMRHFEKLQGLDCLSATDIEHLKIGFTQTDFSALLSAFKQSADGFLTPIFEKFNGKFSYQQLRIARLFVNFDLEYSE